MSRKQKMPMSEFLNRFGTEDSCRDYLASQRWPDGFVCPKCGHKHGCRLSNGLYQCTHCRRHTSVTARTVLHHSHVSLSKWFLAFNFVSQDKRGISAIQLSNQIGVTNKTAWSMLRRIRSAMGQQDTTYLLSGVVEFDDAYFGGPTASGNRGRGTEKSKVFVPLSLDERGNPQYLKMGVTKNIKYLIHSLVAYFCAAARNGGPLKKNSVWGLDKRRHMSYTAQNKPTRHIW